MHRSLLILLGILYLILEGIIRTDALLLVPTSRFSFQSGRLIGGNRLLNENIHPDETVLQFSDTEVPDLIPDDDSDEELDYEVPHAGPTLLRTQLAVSKDISIFSSYARDFTDLDLRFNNARTSTILIAPTNNAMTRLRSKPWEYPLPVAGDDQRQEEIARTNIRLFLESHMFYGSPQDIVPCPDDVAASCLITEGGVSLIIRQKDSHVEFESVISGEKFRLVSSKLVKNGAIWTIDGVLAKARFEDGAMGGRL